MNKRYPCFEDVSALERLTGGDYCAKRGLLAYSLSGGKGIILRDTESGAEELIQAAGVSEGNPAFSPDFFVLRFCLHLPQHGDNPLPCISS